MNIIAIKISDVTGIAIGQGADALVVRSIILPRDHEFAVEKLQERLTEAWAVAGEVAALVLEDRPNSRSNTTRDRRMTALEQVVEAFAKERGTKVERMARKTVWHLFCGSKMANSSKDVISECERRSIPVETQEAAEAVALLHAATIDLGIHRVSALAPLA